MKWLRMIGAWQRRGLGFVLAGLTLVGGLFSLSGCGSSNDTANTDPESSDGALAKAAAGSTLADALAVCRG